MTKKIFLAMAFVASVLVSCTDDYKDWADPQKVGQPETVSFGDGSVSAVDVIKLAEYTDGQATVKVCNLNAPTSTDANFSPDYTITLGDKTYLLNNDGTMSIADFTAYIESTFGKAPIEREIEATVSMWLSNGQTTVKTATSQPFIIKALPDAPFIDPNGYYVVGNIDGWSCRRVENYHMFNNGGDVYDNPVFTVTINAVSDIDTYEIKMVPASAFNSEGNITDWSIALSALPETDIVAYEGSFSYSNAGGNIKFAADPKAKIYIISANLMEGTYTVTPVSFAPYIYEIGNSHGWSQSMPLLCINSDEGKYQGYYYLNGGFKFKPNESNWDGDWGQKKNAETGLLVQDDEDDCYASAGFYQINVDLGAMTYSLTEVTSISIIGTVNGNWDHDTDLTYNTESGAWEVVTELNAGAMKFRMNYDWAISWGGANGDPKAYDNLTQNNGKDLDITEAGTYKIQLFITHEGNNRVVITKQ